LEPRSETDRRAEQSKNEHCQGGKCRHAGVAGSARTAQLAHDHRPLELRVIAADVSTGAGDDGVARAEALLAAHPVRQGRVCPGDGARADWRIAQAAPRTDMRRAKRVEHAQDGLARRRQADLDFGLADGHLFLQQAMGEVAPGTALADEL
jgi:hypothetical protein